MKRLKKGNDPASPNVRLAYSAQGPTMHKFHSSDDLVRIVIGPLGSSKTFGALQEMLTRIHNQVPDRYGVRRSRWCVARNSFPDLESATIPDYEAVAEAITGPVKHGNPPSCKFEYERPDGTTVKGHILFRSFDTPKDVRKARGMQLTGVLVDEIGEFAKSNFDMLIGRVKRYPNKADVPDAKYSVIAIGNAVPRDHWLYPIATNPPQNWFVGVQPGGVIKVGGEWVENPQAENIHNLADNYYQDQIATKADSWIRQNLANEFVHHYDGRPVHPDFNERLHVQNCKPIPGVPLYLGLDWGRTPACLVIQRDPTTGQVRALKELCTTNCGPAKFAKILKRFLNEEFKGYEIEEATGDPSAPQGDDDDTAYDFLDEEGIYALPAETNDTAIRFEALDSLLRVLIDGEPGFVIDPGCEVTIRGLAGAYQFRRIQVSGREEYRDKQDKGETSHPCEALHYGLMGMGEGVDEVTFKQGPKPGVYSGTETSYASQRTYPDTAFE